MADRYDDTLILGYVEGDLSDADRARLEAMMANDAALAALVDAMREDRAALRRLPTIEPPVGLVDAAMSLEERSMLLGDPDVTAANGNGERHEAVRRFRLRRAVGYLAIAAVVVICGGVMLISLSDPWLESGHAWLDDRGLAWGGRDATDTPAPLAEREPSKAPPAATMSSEALIDGLLTQRLEAKRAQGAAHEANTIATPADADGLQTLKGGLAKSEQQLGAPMPVAAASSESAQQAGDAGIATSGTMAQVANTSSIMRVEVDTDDAESTRRDVYAWAVTNAAIIEAPSRGKAVRGELAEVKDFADAESRTDAWADGPKQKADATQEQLTVVLDRRQVPQLLSRLNERSGQRANVIVSSPPLEEGRDIGGDWRTDDAIPARMRASNQMMSEEGLTHQPPAARPASVSTYVAEMPTAQKPVDGSLRAQAEPDVSVLWESAKPAESPEPVEVASTSVAGRFAYGLVLQQQLPLVRSTPLSLFENENSTRVELWINTVRTGAGD